MGQGSEVEIRVPRKLRFPITGVLLLAAMIQVVWTFDIAELSKEVVLGSLVVMWVALLLDLAVPLVAKRINSSDSNLSNRLKPWFVLRERD